MNKLLLFLTFSISLISCKKHQDPLPNVSKGITPPITSTDTTNYSPITSTDTTDYLRPKRSTFVYLDGNNQTTKISEYEYNSDGLLRKIIQYDTLQKSTGDSILFSYTDGWLTKKISYMNSYIDVTTELFTYDRVAYGIVSLPSTYTKINALGSKKYYYYYSNYIVYNVLAVDELTNQLIDSISILDNMAITFLGKGEIDPNNSNPYDPGLCGFREKKVAHYFITNNEIFPDYGLITYDPSDINHINPIYNFGLYQLNNTNYSSIPIPFQKELGDYLMPDAINNYPEAGFFNKPLYAAFTTYSYSTYKYLINSNDLRFRIYNRPNPYKLLSFESHYVQKNIGRGYLTPEGSKTTLYFTDNLK